MNMKMLASASTLAFAMVLSAAYADPNTSTGQGNAQNGTASTASTGQGNAQDGTATTSGNTVASNNNLSRTSTSTNSNNDTSTDTSTSNRTNTSTSNRTNTSTSTRNVSADNNNTTDSGNTTTTNRDTGNNQSRNTSISADNGNNQSRTIDSGNSSTNSSTHNSTHTSTVTDISTVSTDDLRGTVSGINTTLADHGTTAATGAIAGSTYSGFAGIVTASNNTGVGSVNQAATSIAANANVTFGTP